MRPGRLGSGGAVQSIAIGLVVAIGIAAGDPVRAGTWNLVAEGRDCTDRDVLPCTSNNVIPDPARCGLGQSARSAVCWNGTDFQNQDAFTCPGQSVWCTYKTTLAVDCRGGAHPGILYECADNGAPVPALSAPAAAVLFSVFLGLLAYRSRRRRS